MAVIFVIFVIIITLIQNALTKKDREAKHEKKKEKTKVFGIVLVVVMILLSLLFLFPVVWMIANSFKPDNAITADMNSFQAFLPPTPGNGFFDNYVSVITNTDFLKYMGNTLLYAAVLIVLGIIVNGLAGYALAKIKFPFSDKWLLIIMMLTIIPTETIITINFLTIAKMGLLNTIIGYVLPMIVNPFNIFLFQTGVCQPAGRYIRSGIQLDRCGPVKYFFTMVLPMSKTVVATVSVFYVPGMFGTTIWPSLTFTLQAICLHGSDRT